MKLDAYRSVVVGAIALGCLTLGGVSGSSLGAVQDQAPSEQMANRAKGEAAIAEAREHMAAGRWRSAIDAFDAALTYLPDNEEALEGRRLAQSRLNEAPFLADVAQEMEILLGRARTEFNNSMQRAEAALGRGDFDAAQRAALTAQIRLRQDRELFSEREFQEKNQQAQDLLGEIERQRTLAQLAADEQEQLEAVRQRQRALDEERVARDRLIRENLIRIRQLQAEMKYDEALQVIDEILFIDEHNPAALVLRDAIETTMLYREYQELQRRKQKSYAWHTLENQRALIAPQPNYTGPGDRSTSGIMTYPEDWASLSLRRTSNVGFAESAANRRVAQVLSQTRIPVDFRGNRLEDVVGFLGQVTNLNVYVDWKALDFIGVEPDDEVTLQLADVSAGTCLERVLEQIGDGFDRAQWAIEDGMVTISSEEALRKNTVTVVYDIRDLLFEVPYFGNAPQLDLSTALNQSGVAGGGLGGGGFGGGGGGGLGGGAGNAGGSIFSDPSEGPPRLNREELVQQIVSIIQENVDPVGWRDLGGDTGSLQELNGNLIITNTMRNHRAIEGLLSQLREIRALQINVESRFLAVASDWFEQIGVDLDLYFNTNNTLRQRQLQINPDSHLSDFFGPGGQLIDPFTPDPVTFGVPIDTNGNGIPDALEFGTGGTAPIRTQQGFAPIGFIQDSLGLVGSIADLTGFGEAVMAANPALSLGIQFLDDVQVDLLIEATQADRRSVVLTAPRLTFFNGQRAWVAVATQTAFIAALIPITGDAAGAFQPIPGVVSEGVVLDVEGVISADRRYVTMTVIVSLAEILDIREVEVQGAVGGFGDGGQPGGGATFAATQELPEVEVSLVSTTVSVPDKGTVLLGGQRLIEEIEVEAGVPVLSKIPFINRFFTNRLTSKSEETLLILIRPEIIIQQEKEDLLFPGLSDTIGGAASYLQ